MKTASLAIATLILSYAPFYDPSVTCFRMCEVTIMGRGFIERNEGEVDYPYTDAAGHKTVCFGHLIKTGEHFGLMTPDMCGNLLKRDLQPVQAHINWQVNRAIKLNQFDALADLLFNVGINQPNLFKRVNANADPEFIWFDKAKMPDGEEVILKGLQTRRQAESQLYNL